MENMWRKTRSVTGMYTAALVLTEGRAERIERARMRDAEIQIEIPKLWIPPVRVSETVVRRRMS